MPQPGGANRNDGNTLWKLVEIRCTQLSDAVTGARTPFLLALTWAFIWAWALYAYEYSYVDTLRARYEIFLAFVDDPARAKEFDEICSSYIVPQEGGRTVTGATITFSKEWRTKHCQELVRSRFKYLEEQRLDSRWIMLPGGFTKLRISDLSVMGNAGILLILLWWFYATRRENHAILALIDMDENTRKLGRWFPSSFDLIPQDQRLSASHLAYAYHAVSQRFIFLLSTRSRPLLSVTVGLCIIPAVVPTLHLITDFIDFIEFKGMYEATVYFRTLFEVTLLGLVWLVTLQILKFLLDTSVVLNGWYLATRDVWMNAWNEPAGHPALAVHVDADSQIATPIQGENWLVRNEDYKPPKK